MKLIVPALAFVLFVFVGWYTGIDYFQRGGDQAFWVAEGILAGLVVLFFRHPTDIPLQLSTSRAVRLTWTVVITLLVLMLGWYGGVDLSAKASHLVVAAACALVAGLTTWSCPLWKPADDQR